MHVEIERIRRSAAREQPQQSSGLGTVSNQPTKYLDSWPGTEVGNRKKGVHFNRIRHANPSTRSAGTLPWLEFVRRRECLV